MSIRGPWSLPKCRFRVFGDNCSKNPDGSDTQSMRRPFSLKFEERASQYLATTGKGDRDLSFRRHSETSQVTETEEGLRRSSRRTHNLCHAPSAHPCRHLRVWARHGIHTQHTGTESQRRVHTHLKYSQSFSSPQATRFQLLLHFINCPAFARTAHDATVTAPGSSG